MTTAMGTMHGLTELIGRDIDARRDDLIDLCGHLVAAPSVNPPGRTSEVAQVVRRYLTDYGVPSEVVAADDDAPNVVAQINGRSAGRHVVFNAHMDTMEAGDETQWSVPVS